MKVINNILLFIIISFLGSVKSNAQQHTFSIVNKTKVERVNELVILKRSDIEKYAGKTSGDSGYEIISGNDKIVYQTVDTNYDGNWDELVFLSSFKPGEKKVFKLVMTNEPVANTATAMAHVRMKYKNADDSFGESVASATMPYQNPPTDFSKQKLPPYLTEGPGWENDKVAFRLYFDTRNTIDIYGKRIPGMVMDTVGANPANSYHNLSAWGMDILHVVKSLGAGSLAIATKDENGKDTLIRLGGKNIAKETYQQIADGPLYAAFNMHYEWKINGKPVTINQQVSIWGGQYFYESNVTVIGAPEGSNLVSGIADFYENAVDSFHTSNTAALLSHGKQSENKDELGMAVLLPQKTFAFFKEAPKSNSDVMETHLAAQNITDNEPLTFRFYSCWKLTDKRFVSKGFFKQFLHNEAEKFGKPLQVKWK
ncbi:DUF4861 domain-containing protein [Parafilimonas terrae]|uniref:DUF4861 domain-containing protein n=1 Tax=Parafilimonas terrae TaxID=1465490 RepID=A0A1I5XA54_9BACT|nr:DUF4861 domain-containing protein [Parafilimonas terrae]SFQ28527.1 protein of unknown function [Parafilimonas terrae]